MLEVASVDGLHLLDPLPHVPAGVAVEVAVDGADVGGDLGLQVGDGVDRVLAVDLVLQPSPEEEVARGKVWRA